jgi:DNA polymerase
MPDFLNSILKQPTYAQFKKALQNSGCTQCDLHQGRTHIVVDRGNPKASILIVGEAPGASEDEQGKAFVGRAGRLMDQLMQGIGLDTNRDCLIANIAKCRPPKNRAPFKEEAQTCLPFLKRQIELVNPRVMVLLGA